MPKYTFNIILECEPIEGNDALEIESHINDYIDAIQNIYHPTVRWENVDWQITHTTAREMETN